MATYGLQLPDFVPFVADEPARTFERLAAVAVAAEEAGFSSLWVMDHLEQLVPLGGPTQPILECYTLLGALAARTSRVTLGALVTGVTYRNPALLAKQVTTLDVISAGRAVLGIGAAWYEEEHVAYGWGFPPLSERYQRLEDALVICRAMFREEAPSHTGRWHSIAEARNVPAPIRPGGPPIMVGGSGPKRTLRLVAEHADACNVFGATPDEVARSLAILDEHCEAVGRDPRSVRRTSLTSLFLARDAAHADQLRSRTSLRALIGTPDQLVEQVRAQIDAGLDELIVNLPGVADPAVVRDAGEVLAAGCA